MTSTPTPRAASRAASRTIGRPRRWAVPVVVASVLVASACSPVTTNKPYSPSDGLRVNLTDDLRGLNLLVISAAEGEPGVLVGAFSNDTTEDVEFDVTPDGGASLTVPVAAGETVYLGTEDGFDAQFGRIDAAPGSVLPVTVSVSTGEEESKSLPVLDGTLEEYAHLLP